MRIMSISVGAGVLILGACSASAQTPASPLSFEVASIKPATQQAMGQMRVGMRVDAGRVDFANVSLRDCIRQAYRLKDYQISGPDWMGSTRFDIIAKLPEGGTREQVPEMLQAMLAERFKLEIHRETKDLPVYALAVAKGGPKLEKSKDDDPAPQMAGAGGPGLPPPPDGGFRTGGGRGAMQEGKAVARGGMMMMSGDGHMQARRITMSALCDMVSRFMDRPVIDETGIEGFYDLTLEFSPDEMRNMGKGMMMPMPPGADHAGGPGPSEAVPDSGQSVVTSLQKAGLKLESRKAPIEFLMIDHVEKSPTEN